MLRIIAIVIAVVVVAIGGVLVAAVLQPDSFQIARSAEIEAPPEEIYAVLSDFRRSPEWSPYEKLDPDMTRELSGAPRGLGAVYEWRGNDEAGAGRLEIVEATAPSKIAMTLDFTRPFEAHNRVIYSLEPEGAATRVTWAMEGPMPFPARIMRLFFSMDEMVGKDFETGLANLKALLEAR